LIALRLQAALHALFANFPSSPFPHFSKESNKKEKLFSVDQCRSGVFIDDVSPNFFEKFGKMVK
jgi:hypothetical protein